MIADDLGVDLAELQEICARYGIARLEVFGSVARGDAGPRSDIDLLYELQPGARLGWEIEGLSDELAALLGRPVDLISKRGLHRELRTPALREARLLYAA
jgi:predicted nucleotidyltransferase